MIILEAMNRWRFEFTKQSKQMLAMVLGIWTVAA